MVRQGDVLLRRVEALPANAVRPHREGPVILAEGEATGHAHVVDEPSTLFQADERLYVVLDQETAVRHEEHAAVTLGPGVWEVLRQRSYDSEGREFPVGD